jgi:hypothetical protein
MAVDIQQPPAIGLFGKPRDEYGDRYDDHLFEQYKLFVESALRVTEWRNSANNFLLAANTLLVTIFGLAATIHGAGPWQLTVAVAGLLVTLTWLWLILSYKSLNSSKFLVIHEMESELPLALFRYEWDVHSQRKDHTRLTVNEVCIPMVFAVLYAILVGLTIFGEPDDKPLKLDVNARITETTAQSVNESRERNP